MSTVENSTNDGGENGTEPLALSKLQLNALAWEVDSARYLLQQGNVLMRRAVNMDVSLHPVLTNLSIGSEKLLKLALGIRDVADGLGWPSKRQMKEGYGHGTLAMDQTLRASLRERAVAMGGKGYALGLLDEVEADPIWPYLITLMDLYGRFGRFYYLDALAESPQPEDSPNGQWTIIENEVRLADPQTAELWTAAWEAGTDEAWAALRVRTLEVVADSLVRWWSMVSAFASHGVIGPLGRQWGADLHPTMALPHLF